MTDPTPAPALDTSMVTAVMVNGVWLDIVPGSLSYDPDPQFVARFVDGTSRLWGGEGMVGYYDLAGNICGHPRSHVQGFRIPPPAPPPP
jgi:hypothetical protein